MSSAGNPAGPDAAAIRRVLKNSLIESTSGCSRSRRDSRVEPHRPVPTTKVSSTVLPGLGHPLTVDYRTAVIYAPYAAYSLHAAYSPYAAYGRAHSVSAATAAGASTGSLRGAPASCRKW